MDRSSTYNEIRSKSMDSLHLADMEELSSALEKFHYENEGSNHVVKQSPRLSESSIEISIIVDSDSEMNTSIELETESAVKQTEDSGICDNGCPDSELLSVLERKIDILSDLFIEQSELLAALKEEILHSNQNVEKASSEHARIASDIINYALAQRLKNLQICVSEQRDAVGAGTQAAQTVNSSAKALLDALEFKQKSASIEAIIKTSLIEFLQSDELRDHVVAATTESMKHVVQECLSKELFSSYLPLVERFHHRLLRQVSSTLDDAFREMESNAVSLSRSSCKPTKNMRLALERHQRLLEKSVEPSANTVNILKGSVQDILQKELKQWREKILVVLAAQQISEESLSPASSSKYIPSSPPQPTEPGRSAIEQLMKAAEINVQMQEGDVNGSFEKALLALDLPLVMAACRAADPAIIFTTPCQLKQHVLLSLVQQLATDMVHDTQLKCRYLEEAIMQLDTGNPVTRQHLPVVVREVCHHLSSFLATFPGHMCSQRIKMFIMATKSLIKDISELQDI